MYDDRFLLERLQSRMSGYPSDRLLHHIGKLGRAGRADFEPGPFGGCIREDAPSLSLSDSDPDGF